MRGGMEDSQLSRQSSGINGGGAEAAVAVRQPGLLSTAGHGTLEGGFKQLLQHCRKPKM